MPQIQTWPLELPPSSAPRIVFGDGVATDEEIAQARFLHFAGLSPAASATLSQLRPRGSRESHSARAGRLSPEAYNQAMDEFIHEQNLAAADANLQRGLRVEGGEWTGRRGALTPAEAWSRMLMGVPAGAPVGAERAADADAQRQTLATASHPQGGRSPALARFMAFMDPDARAERQAAGAKRAADLRAADKPMRSSPDGSVYPTAGNFGAYMGAGDALGVGDVTDWTAADMAAAARQGRTAGAIPELPFATVQQQRAGMTEDQRQQKRTEEQADALARIEAQSGARYLPQRRKALEAQLGKLEGELTKSWRSATQEEGKRIRATVQKEKDDVGGVPSSPEQARDWSRRIQQADALEKQTLDTWLESEARRGNRQVQAYLRAQDQLANLDAAGIGSHPSGGTAASGETVGRTPRQELDQQVASMAGWTPQGVDAYLRSAQERGFTAEAEYIRTQLGLPPSR